MLLSCGSLFISAQSSAQSPRARTNYALAEGTNEFGLWAGGSPDSSRWIGNTEDRQLVLAALRYGRVIKPWESLSLEYTLDIFPAAVFFEPGWVRRGRSTIYGAGVSPLGLKLNFGQESWIKPFLAASVGFLYFQEDVPVPRSSRFNFTPEVGLGVQLFVNPRGPQLSVTNCTTCRMPIPGAATQASIRMCFMPAYRFSRRARSP